MMDPPPLINICWIAYLQVKNMPRPSMAITSSQSSAVASTTDASGMMPALATAMSSRPYCSMATLIIRRESPASTRPPSRRRHHLSRSQANRVAPTSRLYLYPREQDEPHRVQTALRSHGLSRLPHRSLQHIFRAGAQNFLRWTRPSPQSLILKHGNTYLLK